MNKTSNKPTPMSTTTHLDKDINGKDVEKHFIEV